MLKAVIEKDNVVSALKRLNVASPDMSTLQAFVKKWVNPSGAVVPEPVHDGHKLADTAAHVENAGF
jgi:hypothetical protein